jgi:enamine deaminase RidA (YjgF/YER057c/UK114 family)
VTTYITDRAYREPVYAVVGRHLKGVFPCGTGLIVNGLALPEMLVEIDIEAVIP